MYSLAPARSVSAKYGDRRTFGCSGARFERAGSVTSIVGTLAGATAAGGCFRDAKGGVRAAGPGVILPGMEQETSAMTPSEALSAVFSGWQRGDNDAIADLFSDDGVLEDPLKAGTIIGRESIRQQNAPAVAALEDCTITISHLFEQGDLGFCEGFFASRLVETGG